MHHNQIKRLFKIYDIFTLKLTDVTFWTITAGP